MATQKQIEANRANAQKSTGPKTPEGRAAVRLNGVKHGLTSKILVLDGEQEADFNELLSSLEAEHQPATPSEEILVRQLAMASWRLRRLYHVEAAVFAVRLTDLEEDMEDDYTTKLPDIERLAYVAIDDARRRSVLDNLSRYESRLERSFYKALHELQRLRAQRQSEMKNQTQSEAPPPVPVLVPAPPRPAPQSVDCSGDPSYLTHASDRHRLHDHERHSRRYVGQVDDLPSHAMSEPGAHPLRSLLRTDL